VYEYGQDGVAKVPLPATPEGWIRREAEYAEAVFRLGAPVPRVLGVEKVNGREACIFARVDGVSMSTVLTDRPRDVEALGRELGELHGQLLMMLPPETLPDQHDRITSKVRSASAEVDGNILRVLELLPAQPLVGRLCHGDFHPNNVMMGRHGPVVVDWFDASKGDPCGDIARAALMIAPRCHDDPEPAHLPGLPNDTLRRLRETYMDAVRSLVPTWSGEAFANWTYLSAAARLAEGVDPKPLLRVLDGFLRG
jgi:aminoglycoside phosphotransferase (APT) family kinase protein